MEDHEGVDRRSTDARADFAEARADVAEDNVAALRREVSELKSGTSGLAEQVSTLSLALQTVGQLQRRQVEVEKKVTEVEKKAASKTEVLAARHATETELHERRKRELTKLYSVLGLFAVFLVIGGLYLANVIDTTADFAPLDNSRVQTVNNTVSGVSGPAVLVGQDVSVTGTKCNTTKDPVTVQGVTSWVTINPSGTVLDAFRGTGVRTPGCTTRTFNNQMPAAVIARTKELHASGVKHVTWQVIGLETPVAKGKVVSARWATQTFEIVVR
jgi:hypothetical protein